MSDLLIRRSTPADSAAILSLYPEAFPDEDLLALVMSLLRDSVNVKSLIGVVGLELVGHGIFTDCRIADTGKTAVLLGPLAVTPIRQRQGIGSAIVEAGLACARESGADLVCVLGDPNYYARFGFTREHGIEPPYELPGDWADAWQSKFLAESGKTINGKLVVPAQWRNAALWGP